MAAAAVTFVAAVAATVISVLTFQRATASDDRAQAWEARAYAAEVRASDLTARLTTTEVDLQTANAAVYAARADANTLQSRIDSLAAETGTSDDQRRLAESEDDSALYVLGLADTAAADARQCLTDVGDALSAIVAGASPGYIESLVSIAVTSCDASGASHAAFANGVDGLR